MSQKNHKQYSNCDLCFFIRNRLENLEIATKQRKTKQNQSEPPAEPNTHNGAKNIFPVWLGLVRYDLVFWLDKLVIRLYSAQLGLSYQIYISISYKTIQILNTISLIINILTTSISLFQFTLPFYSLFGHLLLDLIVHIFAATSKFFLHFVLKATFWLIKADNPSFW